MDELGMRGRDGRRARALRWLHLNCTWPWHPLPLAQPPLIYTHGEYKNKHSTHSPNPYQPKTTHPDPNRLLCPFPLFAVIFWPFSSQGFTYPHEAGYPIESRQAKYYLMETHYNNLKPDFAQLHARQMADNSGLKIYFTHVLRPNDAGILSIGKYSPPSPSQNLPRMHISRYERTYKPSGGEQLLPFCIFYATGLSICVYATHVMQFMRLPSGRAATDGCGMAGLTALVGLVKQKLMTLPGLSKCGLVALGSGCLYPCAVPGLSATTARTTNKGDKSWKEQPDSNLTTFYPPRKFISSQFQYSMPVRQWPAPQLFSAAPNCSQIDFNFKFGVRRP